MTKGQCAEKLREMGYDATVEDFIVRIYVDHQLSKKEQRKLRDDIRSTGYQASYGFKVKEDGEKE